MKLTRILRHYENSLCYLIGCWREPIETIGCSQIHSTSDWRDSKQENPDSAEICGLTGLVFLSPMCHPHLCPEFSSYKVANCSSLAFKMKLVTKDFFFYLPIPTQVCVKFIKVGSFHPVGKSIFRTYYR